MTVAWWVLLIVGAVAFAMGWMARAMRLLPTMGGQMAAASGGNSDPANPPNPA